jgi:hypothetical protein
MKGVGQTLLALAAILLYPLVLVSILTAIGSWRSEQSAKIRRLGGASAADLRQDSDQRFLRRMRWPIFFISGAMALVGGVLMLLAE